MCGIVGGKNLKNIDEFLRETWDILKVRGEDGFGVVFFDNKFNYLIFKDIKEDNVLKEIKNNKHKIKNFPYFLAHNRKATLGSLINYKLTHPIEYNSTLLIHNGTREVLKNIFDMESDTLSIAYILDEIEIKNHIKFLDKLLKLTGTIFGFKKSENLFFLKKDKTRTLYYSKEHKIFSSLPIFEDMRKIREISFIARRNFEDILKVLENSFEEKKKEKSEFLDSLENLENEEIFLFPRKVWKV